MFMLSFVGCNDDHTAPHDDQRRKYAEVKYGEYAKDGMYIAKGMYVAKGKYIQYAKTLCTLLRASIASTPRRMHLSRRAATSFLPKKGTTNPLPRMATGWVPQQAPFHKGNQVRQDTVYVAEGEYGEYPK
jgi:hypothetical protein